MPNPQYLQRAKKVTMYYDPRGQVVRTVNPDSTEQWVVFGKPGNVSTLTTDALGLPKPNSTSNGGPTPWESYSYDANDLGGRTHPVESTGSSNHWNTPSSSLLDPLGRTIKTVDRNGSQAADEVVMQYEFDMRGNLLKVTDALDRIAFTHVYDLKPKGESEEDKGANILKTTHIDSGTKTALFDAAFRPTELRDAKGALILHGYDELNRPTHIWAKDNAGEDVTLRQKLIYGDDTTDGPANPETTNHLGKLYQHYDEAGLITLEAYDFKGNVLQKKREVIADSEIKAVFDPAPTDWEVPVFRVDWNSSSALEGEYITDMEYDALNRMKKMVYPEDEDTERKELIPTYNNAGALEKVTMDGDTYVEHIAYNAKGQRLLIAFGNNVMTRYTYDADTFRLSRMKSEKYDTDPLTPWTFEYASGTNRQDIGFDYDLNGNIIRRRERRTDCGITGSQLGADALDRNFSYDPLNRLLSASGRESNTQNQNDYTYTTSPRLDNYPDEPSSNPNANNVRSYTRNYAYDKMGNIQSMAHSASGNSFTRNFSYETGKNRLEEIETGGAVTIEAYTYDSNGNQIMAGTTRNYEWDHSDQLRCYYNQTGTSEPTIYAHYLYDASGNRVKKLVRTSSTNWEGTVYIDGVFEYHKKETASDTYEKNYLHVMDDKSRIAQRRVGTSFPDDITEDTFYVLDDHLGSSNARLNYSTGAVIDREEYYPFGDSSLRTFSKKRYRYVGKEKDLESGLYYYGARYYSAWTCRFISVDALAKRFAQLSPYNYSENNPINDKDIDGNQKGSSKESVQGGGAPAEVNGKQVTNISDLPNIPASEIDITNRTFLHEEATVSASSSSSLPSDNTSVSLSFDLRKVDEKAVKSHQFWSAIKFGDSEFVGQVLSNKSLSPEFKSMVMDYRVSTAGDRFQANPAGGLFMAFVYTGLTGPINAIFSGASRSAGTFLAQRAVIGEAGEQMLVSHTFRHWGTSELRFTLGRNVLKYGGDAHNGFAYSTNELVFGSSNVYQRFALSYSGVPAGGYQSYTIHSATLRGFYLQGQAGRMGHAMGGGFQMYRTSWSHISNAKKIGTTFNGKLQGILTGF